MAEYFTLSKCDEQNASTMIFARLTPQIEHKNRFHELRDNQINEIFLQNNKKEHLNVGVCIHSLISLCGRSYKSSGQKLSAKWPLLMARFAGNLFVYVWHMNTSREKIIFCFWHEGRH